MTGEEITFLKAYLAEDEIIRGLEEIKLMNKMQVLAKENLILLAGFLSDYNQSKNKENWESLEEAIDVYRDIRQVVNHDKIVFNLTSKLNYCPIK